MKYFCDCALSEYIRSCIICTQIKMLAILICTFELCIDPHCMYFTGVGTKIDPTLCRADRLVGQVLGAVGALPDIYTELEISYFLLRRLLGVRTEGSQRGAKVGRKGGRREGGRERRTRGRGRERTRKRWRK